MTEYTYEEAKEREKKEKARKSKGKSKANGAAHETASEADFPAELTRLNRLSAFQYQRERDAVAKRFGVTVTFLDKQVKAARDADKVEGLPEIEPWPEPVDGAALLDDIKAAILRHIRVPTRAEEAIALWVLFTHCYDAFNIAPRLAMTSPMPECGKTTTLELIDSMVPRSLLASNVTAAVVFRAIEKWQPTLIIDEADTFLPENEALRGVLNSGHKRAAAYVLRTVGDDHEPRRFSTWCPMAVALIGNLPPTLASRSIPVELQRLSRNEKVQPFRSEKAPYAHLARKAARWAADNIDTLRGVEPEMPEGFMNRRADNWRPLFVIADLVGGAWAGPTGLAREAALTLSHANDGEDLKAILLADIKALLGHATSVFSKDLAERLGEMEGRPWPEFGRARKPITANAIARLLKPLKVFPQFLSTDDERAKGYLASDFEDAFQRYLPPDPPC